MGKQLPDVALRVWTPQHGGVQFVKQVAPADRRPDRPARLAAGPQAGDYPTGAWGAGESRDYHVCVAVTPGAAGRGDARRPGQPAGRARPGSRCSARAWSGRCGPTTRRCPPGSTRRSRTTPGRPSWPHAIQEGLEARKRGDEDTATAKLGRAVALAQQSGNEDTARLLARVVDVVDAATGTVRLKKQVDDADEMALDTRSTKTVRTRK